MVMTHFEAVESRHLLANTGLDPTFGTNGTVTLPGVTLGDAVVSFPGGYIIEAQGTSGGKNVDYLYKLTAAGRVDTAFGDKGRIVTPGFGVDQLAYDKKYGLLYAAGVTKRQTPIILDDANSGGNTATLRVERFDGVTGRMDTAFGDNGIASFKYGKTNTSTIHVIDIGRLQPLARRGLAVAFGHIAIDTSGDFYETTHWAVNVTLLKYNADGTRDAAFGHRGIVNVANGYHDYQDHSLTNDERYDEPEFNDIQARPGGSLRVLTSRRRGKSSTDTDDSAFQSATETFLVQSQVLTPAGAFDVTQDHSWRVAKTSNENVAGYEAGFYRSPLVRAVGDDGAIAIGTVDSGYNYANEASVGRVTTMTPARRSTRRLPLLDDNAYVVPFARGYYVVVQDYALQAARAIKLKSDLRPDVGYNGGVQTVTLLASNAYVLPVADIDGRLLVLQGNQIDRVTA